MEPHLSIDQEDRRAAYEQEWENVRYQDGLRWSRVKLAAIVEGAILYSFTLESLTPPESLVLAVVGLMLVLLVSLLSVKDGHDAAAHLGRVLALEEQMNLPELKVTGVMGYIKGRYLIWGAIVVINALNTAIAVRALGRL